MARSVPVPKTINTVSSFHHTGPGRARTNPPSAFFKADTKTNSPDARPRPTAGRLWLLDNRSRAVRWWGSIWRRGGKTADCGESKKRGRVLFLAMTDPTAHPAFLAADFAAAFTSATTGHSFSSGLSNRLRARRSHDVQRFSLEQTIIYNRLLARSQEVSWHEEQSGCTSAFAGTCEPRKRSMGEFQIL